MEYEIYKKIELYSTFNFSEDMEYIYSKKEFVENRLVQNNIEYVFQIRENYEKDRAQFLGDIAYCLELIIKEVDLEKVEEIFNGEEKIHYKIIQTLEIEVNENSEGPINNQSENLVQDDELDEIKKTQINSRWIFIIIVILVAMLIYLYN